jgi:AcrR family transcriptional regulator
MTTQSTFWNMTHGRGHGTSRQNRRAEATRKRLLDAARAVFAEKGLDLARIDEITERADVGKGTFYHYFGGKEELIGELLKSVLTDLGVLIQESCRDAADLKDLLDALIGAHIKFFCNRWEDFVLYFLGRSDLTLLHGYSGIETPFLDYLALMEALLVPVIHHRMSEAVLRRIGCAVAGFVSGYYSFAVVAAQEEDIDAAFSSLRSAMVASLARFIQEALPPAEKEGACERA